MKLTTKPTVQFNFNEAYHVMYMCVQWLVRLTQTQVTMPANKKTKMAVAHKATRPCTQCHDLTHLLKVIMPCGFGLYSELCGISALYVMCCDPQVKYLAMFGWNSDLLMFDNNDRVFGWCRQLYLFLTCFIPHECKQLHVMYIPKPALTEKSGVCKYV